jgi:D-inositol-3-phosphate glycosyltransferase
VNILVSMHYTPPHIGGMESVVKKQIHSLNEFVNDVTLLTCRHDRNLPLVERRKTHKIIRYRSLNFIEKKFNILHEVKATDVVHVHDVFYQLSHLTGLAAVLSKKPLYITQHVAMVDHPIKLVMRIQKLIYGTIGAFMFKRARAIIVYNVNVRDFLIGLGIPNDKIHFQYNGIDIEHFIPVSEKRKLQLKLKYGINTSKPVVLFVGRLVSKKGFDVVVEASTDTHHTLIVGTGSIPRSMRNLKNVRFYGPATGNELLELYQASDIFVFPAVGEIFTLVMQEAMACGLPIITFHDEGYLQYDLVRNLIAFTGRRPIEVQKAIHRIILGTKLQRDMRNYSRNLAERKFSWDANYPYEYALYTLGVTG